jgi:hypothetical protein
VFAQALDPAVTVAPTSAQVWTIIASLLGTILTTAAMLWKTSHDQRHQLEMFRLQHQVDREDRQAKAQEVAATVTREAGNVRDRLDVATTRLQDRVESSTKAKSDALDAQTAELRRSIEEAKVFTAQRADAAYHEANTVNQKLEKLHQAHERQGQVLQKLLEGLTVVGPFAERRAADAADATAVDAVPREGK